jgi:hypothetical protein
MLSYLMRCIQLSACICLFSITIKTNSDYFSKHHWPISLSTGDGLWSLWGRPKMGAASLSKMYVWLSATNMQPPPWEYRSHWPYTFANIKTGLKFDKPFLRPESFPVWREVTHASDHSQSVESQYILVFSRIITGSLWMWTSWWRGR